jgi:hypothetical protein
MPQHHQDTPAEDPFRARDSSGVAAEATPEEKDPRLAPVEGQLGGALSTGGRFLFLRINGPGNLPTLDQRTTARTRSVPPQVAVCRSQAGGDPM